MGCLYELPGRNSVAQQSGRNGAASALSFLHGTRCASQWSPDGKQIAFAANMPGKTMHIYIVSADGGALEEVTHGERDRMFPNWSRDGDSLFFGRL